MYADPPAPGLSTGLPSDGGGDWALARRAAVHISGVEDVTIQGCVFERIDGNGVMISGCVL